MDTLEATTWPVVAIPRPVVAIPWPVVAIPWPPVPVPGPPGEGAGHGEAPHPREP